MVEQLATGGRGTLSPMGVGFNLVNTIIGSGILALPYAMKEAGFYFGIFLMIAVAGLAWASLNTLIYSGRRVGLYKYERVSEAALGWGGRYLLTFALVVNSAGSCISYLIIIGDTVTPIVQGVFGQSVLTSRQTVIAVAATGFTLPLLFFHTLAPLVRASVASTLCLPFIVAIVAVRGPAYRVTPAPTPVFGPSVLPALGVIAFAYSCTQTCYQSYCTLERKTLEGWRRASGFAVGLAMAIFLAFSVISYRSFGLETQPNLLNNFASDDHLANVARALLAFSLTLTYPMQFYPIRDLFGESLGLSLDVQNQRLWFHALTLLLFGATLAVALTVEDLGFVFKLIGTAASSLLVFGLPGIIYLRVASSYVRRKTTETVVGEATSLLGPTHPDGSDDAVAISEPSTSLLSGFLLALGVAVFVIGTWNSINEFVSS
ncbi:hypothetical protein COEREDRAFT_94418 [Coemansia reversa NRRL 1564]|uniref:Amino acid transporter transmembrane domain-containing protein n=1 Tax=Coemansia reversa (strain ATCC 12441 / NRRL 1564) TaxID=763665 RepID=A0A2G5B3Z3_COERN|nr:hypothetical protein COEREDRAFT_94418 [Coemansia reversa NRRL 1564]|eukprot:PIA13715.1 hypothetical protein COEREDRAFT_94418 [Coemansia reversa NRRL 1564]